MAENEQSNSADRAEERHMEFEALVEKFEAPLLRYASRILNNSRSCEDVVQTAFIKLHKALGTQAFNEAQMSSWLYRVTHNAAVDYLRKESRRSLLHKRHGDEFVLTRPTLHDPSKQEISDAAAEAAQALKTLSLRERQIVILKVYEEKSYKEISDITGYTEGNVGYILHHALKKLAAEMKAYQRQAEDSDE
jgi:RNA polymerase sigma-70 factor (ECF subfamily)